MFILAHHFAGVDDTFYYIRCEPFQEIYNPEFATEFKSKKEALNWSRENTALSEYAVALDKEEEIVKFQKWYKGGMVRCSRELVNKDISRKYNGEDKYKVLEWWISKSSLGASIRFEDCKTWPRLYSEFKHIHDIERYYNDKRTETFTTFSLSVNSDSEVGNLKEELELILPHTNYIVGDYKVFSIFDKYLSADGTFYFYYKSDKDCKIVSPYNSELISGYIEKVFEYWKRNRNYE